MPVDFFDNPCACSTQKERFGLCDDVAAVDCPTNPAYIDEITRMTGLLTLPMKNSGW